MLLEIEGQRLEFLRSMCLLHVKAQVRIRRQSCLYRDVCWQSKQEASIVGHTDQYRKGINVACICTGDMCTGEKRLARYKQRKKGTLYQPCFLILLTILTVPRKASLKRLLQRSLCRRFLLRPGRSWKRCLLKSWRTLFLEHKAST